jgi:hypothetical protein
MQAPLWGLTWSNGWSVISADLCAVTVIPHSPVDLVRLWCALSPIQLLTRSPVAARAVGCDQS